MIKGLEGSKGINWEVKEEEHILGRYTDQKGNDVTIGILEPCTGVASCMIHIKSKAGWCKCRILDREKETEFVKICQDILSDIEGYNYNPLEGWYHFPKGWRPFSEEDD